MLAARAQLLSSSGGGGRRYITVSGFPRDPVAALVDRLLPEQYHGKTRQEMHITLWHALQAGGGALQRDAVLAAVGKEVAFEVVALDYSPEVGGQLGRQMANWGSAELPAALHQFFC